MSWRLPWSSGSFGKGGLRGWVLVWVNCGGGLGGVFQTRVRFSTGGGRRVQQLIVFVYSCSMALGTSVDVALSAPRGGGMHQRLTTATAGPLSARWGGRARGGARHYEDDTRRRGPNCRVISFPSCPLARSSFFTRRDARNLSTQERKLELRWLDASRPSNERAPGPAAARKLRRILRQLASRCCSQ